MKYKTKHGELDFWDPYPNLNKFIKVTNFKSYSNKLHAEVKKIININ